MIIFSKSNNDKFVTHISVFCQGKISVILHKITGKRFMNHKNGGFIIKMYDCKKIKNTLPVIFSRDSSLLSAIYFCFNSTCNSTRSSCKSKYHLKMNFVKNQVIP